MKFLPTDPAIDLHVGDEARAVIKASDVMIGK
jgi:molybdopterin-binding protein